MPSIFRRILNVLRGKTSAVLDRLEDPEQQLSVFVSDLNKQIQDLQRSVAGAIADEKRLHKQIEGLRAKSGEWEMRAIAALEEDDEDLAKTALGKQEECEAEAAALETGWKAQKEATAQLKDSLKLAKSRTEEARRKYNLLLAQYKSAQTKKKMQGSLDAGLSDSPLQLMEQLEDKIRNVEAEAEAQLALSAESTDVDVEARFHRIDTQRKGDAALDRLKAKLAERKQLDSGESEAGDRVAGLKRALDS